MLSKKERFIRSKCDRCGKSTPAKQNGTGELYTLPHEWPAPLSDQGDFCERCVSTHYAADWLRWFVARRPDVCVGIDLEAALRLCEVEDERAVAAMRKRAGLAQ